MKRQQADSSRTSRHVLLFAAALFVLVSAAASFAQTPPSSRRGAPPPTDAEMQRVFLERNLHITARRHAEIIRKRDAEEDRRIQQARQQIILEQVRRDYRAVQELNKQMLLSYLSGAPDYRLISRHAVEIGRAAGRLKQNLALPVPPEGDARAPQTYADNLALAPMLRVLDTRILSFINNPFFRNPNVLDMEHTNKARRDLEDIISLSRNIRRNALQMQRVAQQNNR